MKKTAYKTKLKVGIEPKLTLTKKPRFAVIEMLNAITKRVIRESSHTSYYFLKRERGRPEFQLNLGVPQLSYQGNEVPFPIKDP